MNIAAYFLLSSFLFVAGVPSGFAQQKRPMTFADLMAMKRVSDPQISPSGKWVLFSVTDVSLEKNAKVNHLWSVPLGGPRVEGQGPRERGEGSRVEGQGPSGAKEKQVTSGSGESNGRFSPDGKWVMYSSAAGEGQLWLAKWNEATGTLSDDQMLPSIPGGADGAIWAPDSNHFLFTAPVYPECESKAVDAAKRVHEEAICNFQHAQAEKKSPVKAQIFESLLYRHWDHYEGRTRSHLFWGTLPGVRDADSSASLRNDKVEPKDLTPASVVGDREAPTYTVGGPLGYAIAPDGKEVAYEVNLDKVPAESTNNDIFVLDPEGDVHGAKKVSTSPGSDDGPQYSPDGKWLAWRSQARNGYESDRFWLLVMDRANGKVSKLDLDLKDYSKPGRPTEHDVDRWVDEFAWSRNSERIYFVSADEGEETVYGTNFTGDDLHRFGKFPGEWGSLVQVPGDARSHPGEWVATYMTVGSPAELVVFDPYKFDDSAVTVGNLPVTDGSGRRGFSLVPDKSRPGLTYVTDLNRAVLEPLDLPKMESFWFAGANGTKVEGFLIRPPGFDPAKKYPLKFLIHGGPQGAWGDAWSYRWNPELFAADGYVVVMINPRGSTGYGQRFLEEVSGDWGGRPYIDLMRGLDYAEATYPFIDKSRECALGASYGGFMANWVLTHTDRFKCIVTHDGMYNPEAAFGDTDELWFNEWEFRPLEKGPGARAKGQGETGDGVVEQSKAARPWDFYDRPAGEDPFRKWSPMLNIRNAKTPTLVVHGQRDYRLDVSEGMQLFTALQLLGVPSKMLYFPDEGHWVLKPQNSELWWKTVGDWCDKWTHSNAYAGAK
jgi:dipeptidyl aminopeptidase/acylaminoacyl peptidase